MIEQNDPTMIKWVLGALATVSTALAGTVTWVWRNKTKEHGDRLNTHSSRIGELERDNVGREEFVRQIERVHDAVRDHNKQVLAELGKVHDRITEALIRRPG